MEVLPVDGERLMSEAEWRSLAGRQNVAKRRTATLTCAHCGAEFVGRVGRLYDSARCKVAFYRARDKARNKIETPNTLVSDTTT